MEHNQKVIKPFFKKDRLKIVGGYHLSQSYVNSPEKQNKH